MLRDGALVYATETWSRRSCQVFESVNLPVKLKARTNAALSVRKCECDGAGRICFLTTAATSLAPVTMPKK